MTPIARHRLQTFSGSLYVLVKDGARIRCGSGFCGVKGRNESGSGYPYSHAEEEREEGSGKFPRTILGQDTRGKSRRLVTSQAHYPRTDEVTRGGTFLAPQLLSFFVLTPRHYDHHNALYCFNHTPHLSANVASTFTKLTQRPRATWASLAVPSILQILSLSHEVLGRI